MQNLQTHYLQTRGPFCQSCGMPLDKPEDFGTGADGLRINDYCSFCYQNGSFTNPGISLQEMLDRCATIVVSQGIMPESQAKAVMVEVIPKLKRWRNQPVGGVQRADA